MHPYIINGKGIMDMFQSVTILELDPSVISTKQLAWLHKAVTPQGNFTIVGNSEAENGSSMFIYNIDVHSKTINKHTVNEHKCYKEL